MATRMIARGRHISTLALLCAAVACLALADLLAMGFLPGDESTWRTVAMGVAAVAGFLIGTTLLRGLGSLIAYVRIQQAISAHARVVAAQVSAEAERGITDIERFLAEQHSRGA